MNIILKELRIGRSKYSEIMEVEERNQSFLNRH